MPQLVIIDTNVLISSLLSSKKRLSNSSNNKNGFEKEIILLFNSDILKEYKEVLYRDKFSFSKELIDYILDFFVEHGSFVESQHSNIALSDAKDIPFYELALEYSGKNVFLITGNSRHFPKEDFIVTPREFIELL